MVQGKVPTRVTKNIFLTVDQNKLVLPLTSRLQIFYTRPFFNTVQAQQETGTGPLYRLDQGLSKLPAQLLSTAKQILQQWAYF